MDTAVPIDLDTWPRRSHFDHYRRRVRATELFPQGAPPANTFDVSSIPWTSFTGFTLNVDGAWDHLAPIFTLGRYVERDVRTFLPLAVQVHHAAADGFHTARLIDALRGFFADATWLGSDVSVPDSSAIDSRRHG